MKKVLIIIPTTSIGGTNSALNNIYRSLKGRVNISVFSLSEGSSSGSYDFAEAMCEMDPMLTHMFGVFRDKSLKQKCLAILPKLLKAFLARFCRKGLYSILKSRIKRLECRAEYDSIVAFQEGEATFFASLSSISNKIAWIHCDYSTIVPESISQLRVYDAYKSIVCVSQYTTGTFLRRYPTLSDKVVTINNLVDRTRFGGICKSSCSKDSGVFRLVSVGRIDSVKRFSKIPSIAKYVRDAGVELEWTIVGACIDDYHEERRLKEQLSLLGKQQYVKWIGAVKNPLGIMSSADLYVCLSVSEACPMVFIESKLLGVPIVSTNFGSVSEFIEDGVDGYIVTFDELGDKLISIAKNRGVLERLKRGMSGYVFDNERIEKQILSLF